MKNIFSYKLALFVLGACLLSCTAEQDVAPVDAPEDNPVATIEPVGDYSTISEGDTLRYTITMSAMVGEAIDWSVVLQEGSTASPADYVVEGGTIQPYSMSTEMSIILLADDKPEESETFNFEISADNDPAYNFQLGPNSDVESGSVTIENLNDPEGLTFWTSWSNHDDDWDLLLVDVDDLEYESTDGATAEVPEIAMIANDETSTSFTAGLDPYDVSETETILTVLVGHPDGTVESHEIVVNLDEIDSYETDLTGAILVANVTKSGTDYTVEFVQ